MNIINTLIYSYGITIVVVGLAKMAIEVFNYFKKNSMVVF